ncbi:MAG: M15 family metallopeptidase [Deltaproteobacteria bacterium]|nr:M15 family metallopeptidase [Deltaproteobacteria bacterium]
MLRFADNWLLVSRYGVLALLTVAGCAPVDEADPTVGTSVLNLLSCTSAQGYVSGVPRTICVARVDGRPVEVHTAEAYLRMQSAARSAGVSISIVSGFRTMAEQQELYRRYLAGTGNLAARPGYSNHQSGLALDLNTSSGGVYAWLTSNGGRYGFIRTVPSEIWHWEFRGAVTCTPRCEDGDTLIDSACRRGECGSYGARCVNDTMGVRCVFGTCPATGAASVCINERTLATCRNGAATPADCGAFAAYCSTAGRARTDAHCVSIFCVDNARDVPEAHNGCWISGGKMLHCDRNGQPTTSDCPSGQACSMTGGTAHCAPRVCPTTGTPTICVDDRYIAHCYNGAISRADDCGAFAHYCSTAGTTAPRCVSVFCVANARERPSAHEICLPDGRRASCTAVGTLSNLRACPAGQICGDVGGSPLCVAGSRDAGAADASANDGGDGGDGGDDVEEIPPEEEPPAEDPDAGTDAGTTEDSSVISQRNDAMADGSRPAISEAGCGCRVSAMPQAHTRTSALTAGLALACVVAHRDRYRRERQRAQRAASPNDALPPR